MDISDTPLIERMARALAGYHLSRNGEGDMASAGNAVDAQWRDHVEAARAVLHTMREPSRAMAATGDAEAWQAMIETALGESSG
jgi:hypothetical protein